MRVHALCLFLELKGLVAGIKAMVRNLIKHIPAITKYYDSIFQVLILHFVSLTIISEELN